LAKVGINAKLQVIETDLYTAVYRAEKLKALPALESGLTSSDIGLKYNAWEARGEGHSTPRNKDANELWDKQLVTPDPEERQKLL